MIEIEWKVDRRTQFKRSEDKKKTEMAQQRRSMKLLPDAETQCDRQRQQ